MAYENSIFRIWGRKGKNRELELQGTGFAVSPRHVMTAWHVAHWEKGGACEALHDLRCTRGTCELASDAIASPILRIAWPPVGESGSRPEHDVTLLELPEGAPPMDALHPDFRSPWTTGVWLHVYGYPGERRTMLDSRGRGSAQRGDVVALDNPPDDTSSWHRISGGPVVCGHRVIGVVTEKERAWTRELHCLPLSRLPRALIDQFETLLGKSTVAEFARRITEALLPLKACWSELCDDSESATTVASHLLAQELSGALMLIDRVAPSVKEVDQREACRDLILLLLAARCPFHFEWDRKPNVVRSSSYSDFAAEIVASHIAGRCPRVELDASGYVPSSPHILPKRNPDKNIFVGSTEHEAASHVLRQMNITATVKPADANRILLEAQADGVHFVAVIDQSEAAALANREKIFSVLTAVIFVLNDQKSEAEEFQTLGFVRRALRLWRTVDESMEVGQ